MSDTIYTYEFYDRFRSGSKRSASVVVPLVLQAVGVKSVVDVGCGVGTWLATFRELGITDTIGLDGEYVDRKLLQIPDNQFIATDLSAPFALPRTFDLAVSLEVAEHLPPELAQPFVHSLVQLAPVVMFSAAIPFQGGAHYVNEQWPDYWAELFKRHDYFPIDCIRGKIWENREVEHWYVQNTFLFADRSKIERDPILRLEFERTDPRRLCLVHPRMYLQRATPPAGRVKRATRALVRAKNTARRRLQRFVCGMAIQAGM